MLCVCGVHPKSTLVSSAISLPDSGTPASWQNGASVAGFLSLPQ